MQASSSLSPTICVTKPLNLSQHIGYVAPSIMLAFLFGPIGILQGIYAKHFGITLSTIATVLLISRLFDAITDPFIGYCSDRYYAKSGSRKPLVVAGALLFIVSSYFLYVPVAPDKLSASTTVSTAYFLGWFLVFYLAWTLFEIPHLAWGSELAPSSKGKNKIYSWRTMSVVLGTLLFYLVPLLPFFETNEFTPQTLQWGVIAAGLLMLPALYFCVKSTPNGYHAQPPKVKKERLWALRGEILSNKPFLLFIAAYFLFSFGSGMWFTLKFIFIDAFLGLGNQFAVLGLVGLCTSLLMVSVWYWIANIMGKKFAWRAGTLLYAFGIIITGFLAPGPGSIVALFAVMLLIYVGAASVNALSPSLLGDIIDYSTWRYGTDRAATYFSFYTLVLKTSYALGGSLGLGIAAWYGFDPAATIHTEESALGLRLATCWLPTLLFVLSVIVMALGPINARRHGIIRRRLDSRIAHETARMEQGAQIDKPRQTLSSLAS